MASDHASFSRRSTVPTPTLSSRCRYASSIWTLILLLSYYYTLNKTAFARSSFLFGLEWLPSCSRVSSAREREREPRRLDAAAFFSCWLFMSLGGRVVLGAVLCADGGGAGGVVWAWTVLSVRPWCRRSGSGAVGRRVVRGWGELGEAYSFFACLSHLTIDHASLSRRSAGELGGRISCSS